MRNFIFGVEDSLVSTVGLLSGIAVAGLPRSTILLTGVILIFVEAFSMAAGSFLSEDFVEEYMSRKPVSVRKPFVSGTVMFWSYLFFGFVSLAPYLFFPPGRALLISIILSLVLLYLLGVWGARISGISPNSRGLRMLLVGGLAIGVGVAAAKIILLLQVA